MYLPATYMTPLLFVFFSGIVEIGPQDDTMTPSKDDLPRPLECHAAKARSPFSDACFILHMKKNSQICKWSFDPVGFIRCSLEQHPNGTLTSKEHDFRRPPQALSCRVSSMRFRRAFPSGIKSAKQDSAALPPWSCRPLQDADAVPAIGNLNLFLFFFWPFPQSVPNPLDPVSIIVHYEQRIQLAFYPLLAGGAWEARNERLFGRRCQLMVGSLALMYCTMIHRPASSSTGKKWEIVSLIGLQGFSFHGLGTNARAQIIWAMATGSLSCH